MKFGLFVLALAAFPIFAQAQQVEVETAAGKVVVEASPEKVAVFDLSAVDDLDALGVPIAGVPDITPPAYLAEAMAGIPIVGTLFEPDLEELAIMAPDLIIAGGRSQSQVEALSEIAPTINMTIAGQTLEDARAYVEAYGKIFGREQAAQSLLADFDAAIADARTVTQGQGEALILLTSGGSVSAYGAASRYGWLHSALGLPEAAPGLTAETHGEAVSFEYIAEVNPDWIFVIDRGTAIGRDDEAPTVTLDNPLVAGTKAAKAGHIVYLDSASLYLASGGIQSMMGIIAEISEAMGAGN